MKRVNPVKTVYGMSNSKTVEQKEADLSMRKIVENVTVIEEDVYEMIKKYHATLIVVSNMIKSLHYCVVGMGFYTIHPKLRDFFSQVDEYLVTEGKIPVLHLSEALTMSSITEYNFSGQITCKQAMTQIYKVFNTLEDITDSLAYSIPNVGISGMFGDHYMYFSKSNWMIKAYLQG